MKIELVAFKIEGYPDFYINPAFVSAVYSFGGYTKILLTGLDDEFPFRTDEPIEQVVRKLMPMTIAGR